MSDIHPMYVALNGQSNSPSEASKEKGNGSSSTQTTQPTLSTLLLDDWETDWKNHLRVVYGIKEPMDVEPAIEPIPPIGPWEYLGKFVEAPTREGFFVQYSNFLGEPSFRYVPNQLKGRQGLD